MWTSIGQHYTMNTKRLHQSAFNALRNIQQVMPHTNWFRAVLNRMRAKRRQQAELKMYQLNSLYTMKAQQYVWANSVIKALIRGHAARAAVSRERHGEPVVAAMPKAKGVQRYRALAKSQKPTAAEVVKNWASELPGSMKRVIPHNITMDGQLQEMATAHVSAWGLESVHQPKPSIGLTGYDGTVVGKSTCPTSDFEKHMDTKCTLRRPVRVS